MHEFSIAQNIVDIALRELDRSGASRISEMNLTIGRLAGIEYDALQFAMDTFFQKDPFTACKLTISKPEGRAKCLVCGLVFPTDSLIIQCPECEAFECEITEGKELKISSITVD